MFCESMRFTGVSEGYRHVCSLRCAQRLFAPEALFQASETHRLETTTVQVPYLTRSISDSPECPPSHSDSSGRSVLHLRSCKRCRTDCVFGGVRRPLALGIGVMSP